PQEIFSLFQTLSEGENATAARGKQNFSKENPGAERPQSKKKPRKARNTRKNRRFRPRPSGVHAYHGNFPPRSSALSAVK
ncbi:MAG TPA: hypothetical protein PKH31_13330, partial [Candidatus Sumerlaeota bacterium]|nr:hypothetical protein [Candidatus Sumerlaeota bacterium]